MTEPTNVADPGQIVAVLTEKALSDMPRMSVLMDRLTAALDDFKTKGDAGLEGTIRSVEACFDYFEDRKPNWRERGSNKPSTRNSRNAECSEERRIEQSPILQRS